MTVVTNFDGGISTRIDHSLIRLADSKDLVNADVDSMVLKSALSHADTGIISDVTATYFKDSWLHLGYSHSAAEYGDRLYFTGGDAPKCSDGINTRNMGISAPIPTLAYRDGEPILDYQGEHVFGVAVTPLAFTENLLDVILTANVSAAGLLPVATYKYRITLVSGNTNVFAVDKTISIVAPANSIRLEFAEMNGITIRVYREYNSGTLVYYKVAELILDKNRAIVDVVDDISGNDVYTNVVQVSGSIQYAVTYYNENDDTESAPTSYTNEIEVRTGNTILIENLPIPTDPQVTHKRIYRIGGNLTAMTLVAELPIASTSYFDYTSDIEATQLLDSYSNYPPDSSMHSLVEAYGMLFGIVGNRVVFSKIGCPEYWPPENFLTINCDCTALLPISQGILIFTQTSTYMLLGTDVSRFNVILLSNKLGCIANSSCQLVGTTPIWLSLEGLCTINSGNVSVISKPYLGILRLNPLCSVVYNECYFMLNDDGVIFVLDTRSGFRFYKLFFGVGVTCMTAGKGELYIIKAGIMYKAFVGEKLSLSYVSPKFTENDITVPKMYHHIKLHADGSFVVGVYIDDNLVLTKQIQGTKTFDIMPPAGKQRGYSCYLTITGVGTVFGLTVLANRITHAG